MYVPESFSRLSLETNKVSIVKVEVYRKLELKVVASVGISGIYRMSICLYELTETVLRALTALNKMKKSFKYILY